MKNINYINFSCGQLWTESFGDPSNPLVVLIAGATKQGVFWKESLCEALAIHGYYVVRYDHRDTGFSTHINFNAHPYRLNDMADDVINVIKYYGKESVHLVGHGMGGYLAQILAINHPMFVKSLVLLMSTYNAISIEQPQNIYSLPSTKPETLKQIEAVGRILPNDPNWTDKNIQILRILNGDESIFDKEEWLTLVQELKARTNYEQSPAFFHHHLLAKTLSKLSFESHRITQPTLIVHGSADPIVPIEHAFATQKIIPNSKLTILKHMGHLFSQTFYPAFIDAVVKHFDSIKNVETMYKTAQSS